MSPEYLSPGVYVEEVDKGAKPIEGVGTAMAAFVGFAEQGPINQPTFIPNWTEFVTTFGGFIKGVSGPSCLWLLSEWGWTLLRYPTPWR